MEFRNVVFNAARDGKLRRLKVRNDFLETLFLFFFVLVAINTAQQGKFSHKRQMIMSQYDIL